MYQSYYVALCVQSKPLNDLYHVVYVTPNRDVANAKADEHIKQWENQSRLWLDYHSSNSKPRMRVEWVLQEEE